MSLYGSSRMRVWLIALLLLFAASDAAAQSRFVVTSPADSGAGTLREAITLANGNADRSSIDFNIDTAAFGPGPWQIAPASSLPEFTAPVIVRGFSQPGSQAPTSTGNGRLMIEILAGSNADYGLLFVRGAEGSSVTGLAFVGGTPNAPALLIMANDVRASANTIGIHADGTPDRYSGVGIGAVSADRITIGGNGPADGNVIFGTTTALMMTGAGHVVRHNWFGMDLQGASTLQGMVAEHGILAGTIAVLVPAHLQALYPPAVQQSFFGLRDALIADNRFAHIAHDAVRLLGANNPTRGNRIQRNVFGRDIWAGPNAYVDVSVRLSNGASDNLVGDNTFARVNSGILLGNALVSPPTLAGSGNRIARNLMFDVAYPLIGLDAARQFAPLANDALDADSGPNGLQNTPELTVASAAGGIEGVLDAAPNRTYTVEFFLGTACHASGFGTADFFLGTTDLSTNPAGRASFSTLLPNRPLGGLQAGDVISATATDSDGNTSEFSRCIPLAAATRPQLTLAPLPTPQPAMDTSYTLQVQITGSGRVPTGEVVFYASTATGRRELGRVAANGGIASLPSPPPGFFVNAGRYEIDAEYSGDGFHAPATTTAQTVVVFRPAIALLDTASSAPVRRNRFTLDREHYEFTTRSWQRLPVNPDDRWIDTERFGGEHLDSMLVREPTQDYMRVDPRGTRSRLSSNAIRANAQIADLLQADQDVRADAIVRDPSAGWLLVHCAFFIDNCERVERLDINLEHEFVLSGEFNGDGFADIAWLNLSSGEIVIWLMDGTKPIQRYTLPPPNKYTVLTAAVDINGDGYEDLVWHDTSNDTLIVSQMVAGVPRRDLPAQLASATTAVAGNVHIALPGQRDYGFGMITLRDAASGEVVAWREPRTGGGRLTAQPQTLYVDPDYLLERTR